MATAGMKRTKVAANEAKWTPERLTLAQRAAMAAVKDGADVYDYATALSLREVQRAHPKFIDIGRAMAPPASGAERQPYFGAILTAAGRDALAKAEGR